MTDERKQSPDTSVDSAEEAESRRAFLLRIAKGVTYSAPLIHTFAAPTAATAQTSGVVPMMTLCDYFPILCMWLGGSETSTFTTAPGLNDPNTPTTTSPLPTAPWAKPPPWGR